MSSPLPSLLRSLGFSANDSAVYLALLAHGPCNAGPLITETGFHRNVVYTSLEHLITQKLVNQKQIRGRKQFSVVSPEILIEDFAKKAEIAKEAAGLIQAKRGKPTQEITIHQGNEEFLALLTGLLAAMPKGSTKYVLGTGGETFMQATMLPIWEKYHEVARKNQIQIRMIGYESQKAAIEPHVAKEGMYHVRYLPAAFENPSGIHIYPELKTVLNIIYSDEIAPVTAICMKDAALTKGYLNLFEQLWKMGKEA